MANTLDLMASGLLLFCAYMSYRGAKRVQAINERMERYNEEYQRLYETGNLTEDSIQELAKKYNVLIISASFNSGKDLEGRASNSQTQKP